MLNNVYCFVDVETTGGIPSQDRVIEVGIVRVEGLKEVARYSTLIDPQVLLPHEITLITGITGKDLVGAPKFRDVENDILELMEGAIFVAHNAQFDYSFLKHEFRRVGKKMDLPSLCTVKLARRLYPTLPRHNLDTIISFLGVDVLNRHRALDDALVLHTFFERVNQEFRSEDITRVLNSLTKEVRIRNDHQSSWSQDNLPEGPGIYVFYGDQGESLYVGKSMDVKARVISHFMNEYESGRDLLMMPLVTHVESHACRGVLGTSILYREFIHTLSPVFNGGLRSRNNYIAALKIQESDNSPIKIYLKEVSALSTNEFANLIGVYRSKRVAIDTIQKILHESDICIRPIEANSSICTFGDKCNYCFAKSVQAYNLKILSTLPVSPIINWPFEGVVVVLEEYDGTTQAIILNNWCLIGIAQSEDEVLSILRKNEPRTFDWQTYQDIKRFFKNKSNWSRIKEIKGH